MNNKLLAVYLERLLDRLHMEISKANNELGPDVERRELALPVGVDDDLNDLSVKDVNARIINAFSKGTVVADEFIESFDSGCGDAIALQGLWEFADSISRDIETLAGREESASTQKTVGIVSSYTGETKTITLQTDF